jgi:hypothetical protein
MTCSAKSVYQVAQSFSQPVVWKWLVPLRNACEGEQKVTGVVRQAAAGSKQQLEKRLPVTTIVAAFDRLHRRQSAKS